MTNIKGWREKSSGTLAGTSVNPLCKPLIPGGFLGGVGLNDALLLKGLRLNSYYVQPLIVSLNDALLLKGLRQDIPDMLVSIFLSE